MGTRAKKEIKGKTDSQRRLCYLSPQGKEKPGEPVQAVNAILGKSLSERD